MRQNIRSIRRDELIRATMAAIYDHGFADLTVAKIARDAGASTGSIHYYFGGKEALLEATMLYLLDLLKSAHGRILDGADNPAERVHAVIQANFDETFMSRETCRVWTQFWAFAPYHPSLARLHRINRARVRSNIVYALRDLVPEADLRMKANVIQGYMDGVWVQVAQSRDLPDLGALQKEARHFVDRIVAVPGAA
ncbi:MAG: transcriptional regulator BetI [Silicimonas sp.]|nr:transcriptional regulator BetI [Silicimonas sp.]